MYNYICIYSFLMFRKLFFVNGVKSLFVLLMCLLTVCGATAYVIVSAKPWSP